MKIINPISLFILTHKLIKMIKKILKEDFVSIINVVEVMRYVRS